MTVKKYVVPPLNIHTEGCRFASSPIFLNSSWLYANFSRIHSGCAVLFQAPIERKNKIVAVNAGHGTVGGDKIFTYCNPDKTPKITDTSTPKGSVITMCVAPGMTFKDGTPEKVVTLKIAKILKNLLLLAGYDVLMLREAEDVQLDNIARTVIANNTAAIHIALHWDGDYFDYDKGAFYVAVPEGLKGREPIKNFWKSHEILGESLIKGLDGVGVKIFPSNPVQFDLTQISFSTIPFSNIELGNQCSDHSEKKLNILAEGLLQGIEDYFENTSLV